jgi:hypothetical protein
METETEIDFCKELKRPLMTVFGLEQLTLYRKTSLIIYVKGNKQVAYQAKLSIGFLLSPPGMCVPSFI